MDTNDLLDEADDQLGKGFLPLSAGLGRLDGRFVATAMRATPRTEGLLGILVDLVDFHDCLAVAAVAHGHCKVVMVGGEHQTWDAGAAEEVRALASRVGAKLVVAFADHFKNIVQRRIQHRLFHIRLVDSVSRRVFDLVARRKEKAALPADRVQKREEVAFHVQVGKQLTPDVCTSNGRRSGTGTCSYDETLFVGYTFF